MPTTAPRRRKSPLSRERMNRETRSTSAAGAKLLKGSCCMAGFIGSYRSARASGGLAERAAQRFARGRSRQSGHEFHTPRQFVRAQARATVALHVLRGQLRTLPELNTRGDDFAHDVVRRAGDDGVLDVVDLAEHFLDLVWIDAMRAGLDDVGAASV